MSPSQTEYTWASSVFVRHDRFEYQLEIASDYLINSTPFVKSIDEFATFRNLSQSAGS